MAFSRTFGQRVYLTVHSPKDEKNENYLVLDAEGLRVDFSVRELEGFSRATIQVYNLNNETIRELTALRNYVTLVTQLHNYPADTLIDGFFVSNVVHEKKVPNAVTTIYCYSSFKNSILESDIKVNAENKPTIRQMSYSIIANLDTEVPIKMDNFPQVVEDNKSIKEVRTFNGSVQEEIQKLGKENNFKLYTLGSGFKFLYIPTVKDVHLCRQQLQKDADYDLNTVDLRATPKLGVATLEFTNNLDGSIEPGTVVDISKLETVGTSESSDLLELASGIALDAIGGYSRYLAITVHHTGSSHTADWSTHVYAVSAASSYVAPVKTWWR